MPLSRSQRVWAGQLVGEKERDLETGWSALEKVNPATCRGFCRWS